MLPLNLEAENDIYARGYIIKGKITLNNPSKKDIAAVEVWIRSKEKALAEEKPCEIDRV